MEWNSKRQCEYGTGAVTGRWRFDGKRGEYEWVQMIATANSYAKLVMCCESGGGETIRVSGLRNEDDLEQSAECEKM